MKTDLTFFTNEKDQTLLDRLYATLKDTQGFDVLVGYFRTSGFKLLAESLQEVEKIRILVGISADTSTAMRYHEVKQGQLALSSREKDRQAEVQHENSIKEEYERSEDSSEVEQSAKHFIEMLRSGRLEIKAHPSESIHAKVYIYRFKEGDRDTGRVITGSSNFSHAGFLGNYEFNVELKNPADFHYASEKFEALWQEGIDLKEVYLKTLQHETWLKTVTPYEIYLKCLYEYFEEDINDDAKIEVFTPQWFMKLRYQEQAVTKVTKILKEHGGAFISDVVGLGKTPMAAMVAQTMPHQRKLFVVPPPTIIAWKRTLDEFRVPNFTLESA
ncbi:MAG: phospholipase D-like domain-containing protein, partial [Vampirovibrionales bacterium]